jgi:hypothetical protein
MRLRSAFLFLSAVLLLSAVGSAEPIVPTSDLLMYGPAGELISIWGEHNFYQDTLSFGHVLAYRNGTYVIGGNHAS